MSDDEQIMQDIDDYDDSNYEGFYEIEKEDSHAKNEIYDGIQGDVKFLKQDHLLKERDNLINEASQILCLSKEETTLALIYYKWSIEILNEGWFEDVEKNKILCGIVQSASSKKQVESVGAESNGDSCLICFDSKSSKDDPNFFSLSCGHVFCNGCWTDYLVEKSKLFANILDTRCPQEGCSCKVYESLFFKFISDTEALNRLRKGIIKNYIENNKEIKYCPNPKCSYCIRSSLIAKDITCLCKTSFCFKCNKESHKPCTCEMYEKWKKKTGDLDNENNLWIKANTKECPHCHQRIEKSQGCNYMYCDPKAGGCGKAFCYVCSTDWAKHSQDHFKCNKYTDAVKAMEKKADQLKIYLKRFDFYSTRYINYMNAVKICDKKLREKLKEKIDLIVELKHIPIQELYFIYEALDAVISGKKSLSNTYIFGFYLKDGKNKEFFEFSQALLERNADELNGLLEHEDLNNIIQAESFSETGELLMSFRNRALNLTAATIKYRDNLIQEIEDKYLGDIDMVIYNNEVQ